jgi:hypothetical protein
MLTVTDAALGRLSDALSQNEPPRNKDDCFRMTISDEQTFSIAVQPPEPGDHTFDREGETVLAVPREISKALSSSILDLGDNGGLVMLPKPS